MPRIEYDFIPVRHVYIYQILTLKFHKMIIPASPDIPIIPIKNMIQYIFSPIKRTISGYFGLYHNFVKKSKNLQTDVFK